MAPGMRRLATARSAALALAAAALAAALPACSSTDGDADDEATTQKLGLKDRTVHDYKEKAFKSDGVEYTLVRIEYGDTEECDLSGDCSYSTYCGFLVDGKEYPLEVSWVSDAD